jgi:Rhodanese-like domain
MGNTQSTQKVNFEDIQTAIKNPNSYLLINTLPNSVQTCLIKNTVLAEREEELINQHLKNYNKNLKIILYGKNTNDPSVLKKYSQLTSLGFTNVYIYQGGLFEWLLLQDIYGTAEFPTTSKELDILKYKPTSILNIYLLEN